MVDVRNPIIGEKSWRNSMYKRKYCFIYGLSNPMFKRIRYVGRSVSPKKRYKQHLKGAHKGHYPNRPKNKWLREVSEMGFYPKMEILERCLFKDRHEAEADWIRYYLDRDNVLLNSDLKFYARLKAEVPEDIAKKFKEVSIRDGYDSINEYLSVLIEYDLRKNNLLDCSGPLIGNKNRVIYKDLKKEGEL